MHLLPTREFPSIISDFHLLTEASPNPNEPYLGATQPAFFASFAYFLLCKIALYSVIRSGFLLTNTIVMGLLCLIYLVASLRTNIIFVIIFATLVIAFGLLAGAYWQIAQGAAALGGKLVIVSISSHVT